MDGVKPPLRLRLEPRPSRIGCALALAACVATATLLAGLPLPWVVQATGGAAIASVAISGLWRWRGRGVPALLHVSVDRRITVTGRDGRSRDGAILDDSYVGAWLTTVVWRADREPWWRPARAILILPDMLPPDDFRRLRVMLRYGRPVVAEATSGAKAG